MDAEHLAGHAWLIAVGSVELTPDVLLRQVPLRDRSGDRATDLHELAVRPSGMLVRVELEEVLEEPGCEGGVAVHSIAQRRRVSVGARLLKQ